MTESSRYAYLFATVGKQGCDRTKRTRTVRDSRVAPRLRRGDDLRVEVSLHSVHRLTEHPKSAHLGLETDFVHVAAFFPPQFVAVKVRPCEIVHVLGLFLTITLIYKVFQSILMYL